MVEHAPNLAVWRYLVLQRDGEKCMKCGATTNLQAHHIKPRIEFPEFMLDIENGITLCRKCHTHLHGEMRTAKSKNTPVSQDVEDGKKGYINFQLRWADYKRINELAHAAGKSKS